MTTLLDLPASPLAPGVSPVRIRCRESGRGAPLVFLHGGWGYAVYPFDVQAAALGPRHRIIIPDRSGYGGSTPIDRLDPGFHRLAADETMAVLDQLAVDRPVLWGHSDGAVIAALIALAVPDRISAVVLEAMHLSARKPSSREFFETTARDPDSVGDRVAGVLAADHGERWREVISRQSRAWLRMGEDRHASDFYGGRLGELRVPTLIVHGARDPRTEPGEIETIAAALRDPELHLLPDGGHSPHSERATADTVTMIARRFLHDAGD